MKKLLFAILLLFLSVVISFAQTQTGYVRTVGRPDNNAGERLSDVQIKVSGLHGSVVSKEQGYFDFDLQGGKDSYQLTSVILDNYELNEKEIIGRTFGVTKVPQEIVMVSLAEKNRIRREVEERVEARYKVKYDDLQRKLESKEIEVEDYRRQLQELESIYDKREQLVSDMVERYSHTDYAVLKPIEAEIDAFIEQGELEKADSVINTLNISKLEADRKALIEDIKRTDEKIAEAVHQQAQKRATKSNMDSVLLMVCQGKINIAKASIQIDSAIFYYKKLIDIDTTNIGHLLDGGDYFLEYVNDFNKALYYYESALEQCFSKYGKEHRYSYKCYLKIGKLYYEAGDYTKALYYSTQSLKLAKIIPGIDNIDIASAYNNVGMIYYIQNKLDSSLIYHQNALNLMLTHSEENQSESALFYNNMASFYFEKADYNKALDLLNYALEINNDDSLQTAEIYNNIGSIYHYQGMNDMAINYFEKALQIWLSTYGETHPTIALAYNNISCVFHSQKNYSVELDYLLKALHVYLLTYGDFHPDIAVVYNNLGTTYYQLADLNNALEYHSKALKIKLLFYDENHPSISDSYSNLASVLCDLGRYDEALVYSEKAIQIKELLCEDDSVLISDYITAGSSCFEKGDFSKAAVYLQKGVDCLKHAPQGEQLDFFYISWMLRSANAKLKIQRKYSRLK